MSITQATKPRGRTGMIAAFALLIAAASASAQTPAPAAGPEAVAGNLWIRDARLRAELQPDPPELVRHHAPHQAAHSRRSSARTAAPSPAFARSRLGVRSSTPTDLGDLTTIFEFELFGTGVDEGQTTFRLRHAYGELGAFGAGQYWSPFMDIDVFPNSLEYWGPTGMVFFRNVQVRWMPIKGDTRLTIALERPGASGDAGVLADRIELQNVQGRFPAPDFSGEYRMGGSKGYVEVAGILRYMKWDDVLDDQFELSDSALGWGINLSSNIKFGSATRCACRACSARASRTT